MSGGKGKEYRRWKFEGHAENGTLRRVKRDRNGSARLEKSPLNVYYYNNDPMQG